MNLAEKCRMLTCFLKNRKLSDLKKLRQERQERNDSREKHDDKEKNSLDIKIKINNIEKQTPEEVAPEELTSRPPDDYELEEGFNPRHP